MKQRMAEIKKAKKEPPLDPGGFVAWLVRKSSTKICYIIQIYDLVNDLYDNLCYKYNGFLYNKLTHISYNILL
jgi:hypothetical protein